MVYTSVKLISGNTFNAIKVSCLRYLSSKIPSSLFNNVVIVSKRTGYEYEKLMMPSAGEEAIRKNISRKGRDYNHLIDSHQIHTNVVKELTQCLLAYGLKVKLVNSNNFDYKDVEWSDLIITTGGDGTFLSAAIKLLSQDKTIVGINSHPSSSEGSLCLPKEWFRDISGVVDRLITGSFSNFWRQRIRIVTSSPSDPTALKSPEVAPELITLNRVTPRIRHAESEVAEPSTEGLRTLLSDPINQPTINRLLPIRALNEIFISTCMSARISEYEISLDDSSFVRQKSSGIAFCTGSGSTAWHFSMNQIHPSFVSSLLKRAVCLTTSQSSSATSQDTDMFNGTQLNEVAEQVAKDFNHSLIFDSESCQMAYSIRDLVRNSVFKFELPYGFTKKVRVLSRMDDAYLSIDCRYAIPFHDGTWIELSIHPEDALRTVKLID